MAKRVYIGIDPGMKGAIAINCGRSIDVYDFLNLTGLLKLQELRAQGFSMHACLEKVGSMPKQGIASAFKFGTNFGWWQGVLQALQIPFDLVTPQKWQNDMFDIKVAKPKDVKGPEWKRVRKEMSLTRARVLYPSMIPNLTRKMDDGRSDALLVMGYCEKKYGENQSKMVDLSFLDTV